MDTDYLIVGAGCAGLSLATHLAARGLGGRRVIVVDPRPAFARDHTWCFWDVHDHPFADAVTHRWARWRVAAAGADVVCGSGRYSYQHLPADAFYAAAIARLRDVPGVELRLGQAAGAVTDLGDHVQVATSGGAVRARVVFDSRVAAPRPTAGGGARSGIRDAVRLSQQFVGLFVRADRPAFDPGTATLMHFAADAAFPGAICFTYVLPFSPYEALVEATAIAGDVLDTDALAHAARRYLAAHHPGVAFAVLRTERGHLPMSTAAVDRRPSPRVYRIGLAGGLAKPSTGYAFLAIQRDSAELARRLAQTELPEAPRPRGVRATFLDRVFLSYLERHPARAPALFARLFARAAPDVVVRFLSDTGSLADQARVAAALPLRAFVAEAVRSAPLWLRA